MICPVFVNKVVLDHGHTPSFTFQLWLFHAAKVELSYFLQGPCGLQILKLFLSGSLQKNVADPCSSVRFP